MSATQGRHRLLLELIDDEDDGQLSDAAAVAHDDRWSLETEDDAQWVVGLMVEADAAIERHQAQAAARLAELRGRRDRLTARFGAELEAWAKQEAERRGRRSVTLLTGTVAFRKVPGRLKLADQAAAEEVGEDLDLPVFAMKRVFLPAMFLDAAQKCLDESGELLPGVELVPERDSMSIGVAKPKAGKSAPTQEGGEG